MDFQKVTKIPYLVELVLFVFVGNLVEIYRVVFSSALHTDKHLAKITLLYFSFELRGPDTDISTKISNLIFPITVFYLHIL